MNIIRNEELSITISGNSKRFYGKICGSIITYTYMSDELHLWRFYDNSFARSPPTDTTLRMAVLSLVYITNYLKLDRS